MGLCDRRLTSVMEAITERICQRHSLVFRQLAVDRSEEVKFGRFISNERVRVCDLEQELYGCFRAGCPDTGHILLIEDSSQMAFGLHRKVAGLGKVDKGQVQGFYLHPALALDAVNGACYGIASTTFIKREFKQQSITRKQINSERNKTAFEEKESSRWLKAIAESLRNCPTDLKKTVVADREADIYPVLTGLAGLGVDYVIRGRFNRPLAQRQKLYEFVDTLPEEYRFCLPVPATEKRSAHTAVLKVKFGQVVLKKSSAKTNQPQPEIHTCWVVKVEEDICSVIAGQPPVEWLLFTSHQVESTDVAMLVVGYYRQRWNIEQLFRTLKSKGLGFEESQIKTYERMQKLLLITLRAAVRILQMVRARDGNTGQSIACAFTGPEAEFLVKLNAKVEGGTEKLKNPHAPTSLAFAAWVIARLSGWSGYQSQRPPGPTDFLVGLKRFDERFKGYLIAKQT